MVSCCFLGSIGVGLDRVGVDWTRFWGEFWRGFVIFGHFWPFLAIFGAIFGTVPAGEPQISVDEGRFEAGSCGNGLMLFVKSIGVGLDQVGGHQRQFGAKFWRIFVIFGHFWPFSAQNFR